MKLIEVLSFSKTYNGRGKFFVKWFSILVPFFKYIKKILIKKNLFYKKAGYSHPYKFVSKLKKIKFFDLNIIVPFLYINYLDYTYGKNWRKPKKVFRWWRDSPSTIISS